MPLYEYRCAACGQRFELIQKYSDPAPDACRLCGKGPVERLLSSPAIQFKGSGWYITDYAKKGGTSGSSGSAGASSESKPAGEAKSETKSESTSAAAAPAKSDSSSSS